MENRLYEKELYKRGYIIQKKNYMGKKLHEGGLYYTMEKLYGKETTQRGIT